MMRDLDALASQARGYLVDKGYARSTIAHYEAAWKRLMSWCEDEGIGGHGHDVERRLMEEVAVANADATRCLGLDKSRVLLLPPVGETGEPPDREARRRFVVPAGLGATRPERPGARSVGVFAEAVSHCAPQARSARPCVARDFTRLPAGVGACGPEVAAAVPHVPGHRHPAVPSACPAAEVSTMSGGFPRSLRPRRDRAMMLLASVLGMRAGDTEAPGLSDIGWRARAAPLARREARVANAPRMPEEVWLAVADYIRCERPDVDGDRVFVTACAPHHATGPPHASRGTVTRAFADAGAGTAGERCGTRGPCRPAAGDMPPGGTPYPTISSVLGHGPRTQHLSWGYHAAAYPTISSVLGHGPANVTKRHPSADAGPPRPPAPGVPSCL